MNTTPPDDQLIADNAALSSLRFRLEVLEGLVQGKDYLLNAHPSLLTIHCHPHLRSCIEAAMQDLELPGAVLFHVIDKPSV